MNNQLGAIDEYGMRVRCGEGDGGGRKVVKDRAERKLCLLYPNAGHMFCLHVTQACCFGVFARRPIGAETSLSG
jgi:hypothetical protein